MLRCENVEVQGFEAAIRGMRNPMNSWHLSDTADCESVGYEVCEGDHCPYSQQVTRATACIGPNDLDLMQRLFKAGTEHRKYARMIVVYLDVIAPLYWWKEADTYKVGTVANSCSTMHKVHAKEFTEDDFSCEHLRGLYRKHLQNTIVMLNDARDAYLLSKDKDDWWQMIQLLPSCYNQRRTLMVNYEVLANIYRQRHNHKLDEWHTFCDMILTLPYFTEITGIERTT